MGRFARLICTAASVVAALCLTRAESRAQCDQRCWNCVCADSATGPPTEPDSTRRNYVAVAGAGEFGVTAGILDHVVTLPFEAANFTSMSAAWVQTVLHSVHSAVPDLRNVPSVKGGPKELHKAMPIKKASPTPSDQLSRVMTSRVAHPGVKDKSTDLTVSASAPIAHSTFRIAVRSGGATVWTRGGRAAGVVARVGTVPTAVSGGAGDMGAPTCAWVFPQAIPIRVMHGAASGGDTTITGDQIRIAREHGVAAGSAAAALSLHCSSVVDTLRISIPRPEWVAGRIDRRRGDQRMGWAAKP